MHTRQSCLAVIILLISNHNIMIIIISRPDRDMMVPQMYQVGQQSLAANLAKLLFFSD